MIDWSGQWLASFRCVSINFDWERIAHRSDHWYWFSFDFSMLMITMMAIKFECLFCSHSALIIEVVISGYCSLVTKVIFGYYSYSCTVCFFLLCSWFDCLFLFFFCLFLRHNIFLFSLLKNNNCFINYTALKCSIQIINVSQSPLFITPIMWMEVNNKLCLVYIFPFWNKFINCPDVPHIIRKKKIHAWCIKRAAGFLPIFQINYGKVFCLHAYLLILLHMKIIL